EGRLKTRARGHFSRRQVGVKSAGARYRGQQFSAVINEQRPCLPEPVGRARGGIPMSPIDTSISEDLKSVVAAYRTCEFLTVSRDGTPIAWPTISVRQ